MGVKGLYTYLKPYRHDIWPDEIVKEPSLRIAFDAMSMLYKYKSNYPDMFPMLQQLKAAGHRLLFIFDGKPPTEKEEEVTARREARADASAQAVAVRDHLAKKLYTSERERQILEYSLARLEFQGWHMTREIRHEFQAKLWELEIPYVKALAEADDVLVDMAAAEKVDVVVSTDMDFLLSGVRRLWIPFRKGGAQDGFEEVLMDDVLSGEGLSPAALCDAGILCGVEPLRAHAVSVGAQTAFGWMRHYQSMEAVLASSVKDRALEPLRDAALLERAREHFRPRAPWTVRIRPDHFERFRQFLEAL